MSKADTIMYEVNRGEWPIVKTCEAESTLHIRSELITYGTFIVQ
jgi:hypothetical protein